MTITRQRFGKRRLKAGVATDRSRSPYAKQRLGNTRFRDNEPVHWEPTAPQTHIPVATDRMTTNCSRWWPLFGSSEVINGEHLKTLSREMIPCGGGVEYLHRSPASRRRRRKERSRIRDSKIWSRVPRDSDSRMTALLRTSSNCKWQTRPLVRGGVPNTHPQLSDRNKNLVLNTRWVIYSKTDWPTDHRS
jgi:hypothetical protein